MKRNDLTNKIGIVLTIVYIVLLCIDIFGLKDSYPKLSGYLCNITTECIGLFITICIIQKMLEKNDIKKEKQNELEKIKRQNKIISIYLNYFIKYFHCITTPLNNRFKNNVDLNSNFTKKDLCDLHKFSMGITDPLLKSSIVLFYEYEHRIRNEFMQMLNNIDFKYYLQIQGLITEFIQISLSHDVSDVIVSNEKLKMGNDKKTSQFIEEMFQLDNIEELYSRYKNGNLQGNIIIPYFILFDLLKIEQELLINYLNEINNLSSD